MKYIKYTDWEKIEKYVNDIEVVTFVTTRNTIQMSRFKHGGKAEYIRKLIKSGYTRAVKEKTGA